MGQILERPREGGYASYARLTSGMLAPTLVPDAMIDVAELLA